jgi:hypothetical protein
MQSNWEYESIRAKTEEALVGFLRAELEIGRTFAQSAVRARDAGRADDCARTTADAVKAVETIRRFMSQITDADTRAAITNKLVELDRLISAL